MTIKLDFQTVKNLKKPGRYTDALVKGLHIWIKPTLSKYWIFRFSVQGKQHNVSLGSFPAVGVSEARIRAEEAREKLGQGIHLIKERQVQKQDTSVSKPTFREYALACVETKRAEWKNQKHGDQWVYTLKEFAFPVIGEMHLDQIETKHILEILDPIWVKNTVTASRLRGRLEWILASATTRELRSGMNPSLWRGHLRSYKGILI